MIYIRKPRRLVPFILCFIISYILCIAYLTNIIEYKNKEINELKTKNNQLSKSIKVNAMASKKVSKDLQLQISEVNSKVQLLLKKRILTSQDIDSLNRIVEAEASTQGLRGKLLVTSTILNRWLDTKNKTIDDIVTAPGQFQPVANGKYYSVKPTQETKQAVVMAIERDYSKGSRYFMNPKISSRGSVKWFRESLELKTRFKDHEFYSIK